MVPAGETWTCIACAARHPAPTMRCRRCGADLLMIERLRIGAARLRAAGLHEQADALAPGPDTGAAGRKDSGPGGPT